MSQENYSTREGKKKHTITEKDRYRIEGMLKAKTGTRRIAEIIGCSQRSIEREIQRGTVEQLSSEYKTVQVYKADYAQMGYEKRAANKGRGLKIGKEHEFAKRIEELIVLERYSPDAAIAQYAREHSGTRVICTLTLYSYIWDGLFVGLCDANLPRGERKTGKREHHHRKVALNNTTGRSIEERTAEINERKEEGHWEMDTVVGKPGTKACLLVLTERKKSLELIFKLKAKTEKCVVQQMDILERKLGTKRFCEVFKSITCDNGCENLDWKGIERSVSGKQKRTIVYYAHPYSAYERGANEGANVLIRRFVPKGTDIAGLKLQEVKRIARWMNHYPRRKLDYSTAFDESLFAKILASASVI